jgi:hypothetical protein
MSLARKLDVPVWRNMFFADELEGFHLLDVVNRSNLDVAQRRRARHAVAQLYARRLRVRAMRPVRKAKSYILPRCEAEDAAPRERVRNGT